MLLAGRVAGLELRLLFCDFDEKTACVNTKHLGWVGSIEYRYETIYTESKLFFLVRSREFKAFQALHGWELMDDMDVDPDNQCNQWPSVSYSCKHHMNILWISSVSSPSNTHFFVADLDWETEPLWVWYDSVMALGKRLPSPICWQKLVATIIVTRDLKVTLFLEGHICFFVSETLPTLHWGVGVGTRWAIKSTSEPFSVGRVGRKGILQQKRVGLAFRNEIQAWWNIFHANLRAHPPLKQGPNKAYLRPTMLVFPIPK